MRWTRGHSFLHLDLPFQSTSIKNSAKWSVYSSYSGLLFRHYGQILLFRWLDRNLCVFSAAAGWDAYIRGRTVRTGESSSPNLAQIPGPELLVESKHSQHVQPDMTKDNSMRKQLACIPQFKPIGNDSIKQDK